ncbi:MAG TPA: right-handed parallel beta-helix repeat-containing protein [Pseudonocardia sp.]|jgi:hypothetical protein|nr:right-handed parallel beta-helix repeat-containing protein [Pseudonocardia sp.]
MQSQSRRPSTLLAVVALLCVVSVLAGCGGESSAPPPPSTSTQAASPPTSQPESKGLVKRTAPDGRGAVRPLAAPTGCTSTVTDPQNLKQVVAGAQPGNTICLIGDLSDAKLSVKTSGTQQAPIKFVGDGNTEVKGISVRANWVVISGLNLVEPKAPGVSLDGNNIVLTNTTVDSPHEDDGDGVRFWGTNLTISHNTIAHTRNKKAHADCMQTFATDEDSPASQHVVIDSNRCEDIANTCLIMEGPHSLAGDGSGIGVTSDVLYNNNYCDNRADQALQIDDVQNLRITNNEIAGDINHAFALQNKTTGAKISGNKLNSKVRFEVGMDASSLPGYSGPPSGGAP